MVRYLFTFKGRMRRLFYFCVSLFTAVLLFIARGNLGFVSANRWHDHPVVGMMLALNALTLVILICWIELASITRRLRDMGAPIFSCFAVVGAAVLIEVGLQTAAHHNPALAMWAKLLGMIPSGFGLAMTFWRSAPQAGLSDARLDEIFGEDSLAKATEPSSVKPAMPTVQLAPRVAVHDAFGQALPRAQFGLRRSGFN